MKKFWTDIYYVFKREFYSIFRDEAVIIFFLGLTIAYPLLYTYIYSNENAKEVPVAVVDNSNSSISREFLRNWNATESVDIIARCADIEEAKQLLYKKEIYGIMVIPDDFGKKLVRSEQAYVSLYCDMGALLNYKALLLSATDVSLAMNAAIQVQTLEYASNINQQIAASPVKVKDVKLFNPAGGFTSFLIPAVLILILQQSLLLGVGSIAGAERDRRRKGVLLPVNTHFCKPTRVVLGKACAYLPIYLVMSYWVLFIVPRLFHMTQIGYKAEILLFIFPFLLASVFFAITMSFLCRERETPYLIFVFMSLPLVFMSGISWPKTSIPEYWLTIGRIFPSTHAIDGFVKMNNGGASLSEVLPEYYNLWILAFVYFCISFVLYYIERRSLDKEFAHLEG